jgi:hypothetical protein
LRNFAVKFAILLGRFREAVSPQFFLDLSPTESLAYFRRYCPDEVRAATFFGFSDNALLNILDQEFEVEVESNRLVFQKTMLDAESIILANDLPSALNDDDEARIHTLAKWLFEATRSLYRRELSPDRLRDIQEEYRQGFRLFIHRYGPDVPYVLLNEKFENPEAWLRYTHAMTIDALYKADAAQALFGEESGYAIAWRRKELFRNRVSQLLEKSLAVSV